MKKRTAFPILMLMVFVTVMAQGTRPVRDPIGYVWAPNPMNRLMDYLLSSAHSDAELPPLVAGICPHDDFLYAGPVYLPIMRRIHTKEVIIFGVTHHDVRLAMKDPKNVLIMDAYDNWKGPYGPVAISPFREILKKELPTGDYMVSNKAQALEHSIEGMVPFLQYFNRKIKITPVMVTGMSFERMEKLSSEMAKIIVNYMKKNNLKPGRDVFFLISSDANHYGEDFDNTVFGKGEKGHDAAVANDWRIAREFLSGKVTVKKIQSEMAATEDGKALWCGRYSIPFGMLTTMKVLQALNPSKEMTGHVLRYADTYSNGPIPLRKTGFGVTAPFSLQHWVGHLSMGYWLGNGEKAPAKAGK
ncbi:MAG: AmmeMemoRadiSam system protein B [Acidobacteria bacterium]|nr:MAG: AmmeMemoRadiSam system protein B [Acidobacteriota bacterium]RLE24054.1 MAG: AmmeMemoRadiSam system protein B [Acidobacteriota bacterium]